MFQSILFEVTDKTAHKETLEAPEFFQDLNLNQIIDAITAGKQEYNLKPLFYKALHDIGAIKYRQEITLDLENETLLGNVKSFGLKMATVRRDLAMTQQLEYTHHREGWHLDTINTYCEAVNCLIQDLNLSDIKSRGLLAFREYLNEYSNSSLYKSLLQDTKELKADLSTVKYCLQIERFRVRVRKYQSETDYSQEVAKTFEKFKQGNSRDYRNERFFKSGMNPLQAEILHFVARLYPEIFSNLARYCGQYINFIDEAISLFDQEVQFYIAYLDFIAKIKEAGLRFCYPQIINDSKEIHCYEGFDLALAYKCLQERATVVCNDFYLQGKESIFIVSGPDQGGKATFSRTSWLV
jgi:DNA mismatch repair protein MutS